MSFEDTFGDYGTSDAGESRSSGFTGLHNTRQVPPVQEACDDSIELLGSSPNQDVSINQVEDGGQHFLYQLSDGQWLFMHPINVRS